MSSSSSKRRKVTVDIKQTKLERGSVFARLGNKDKHRKKPKEDPEPQEKLEKEQIKQDFKADEAMKKSKSRREDEAAPTKKSKDYSSSGKSKTQEYEPKQPRKSRRRSEERHVSEQSESYSSSKRKPDRGERKMENLVIQKRVSPLRERSKDTPDRATVNSMSPKKKSKKHSAKRSSVEKTDQPEQSLSPDRSAYRKHKERGRSREKKKSKDLSKKIKESLDSQDNDSEVESRHSSKSKKSAKRKTEKDHPDDVSVERKSAKPKTSHGQSKEHEKGHRKISPVVYDPSSDDQFHRKQEKEARSGKNKRKRQDPDSPRESPVRHKKSKKIPEEDYDSKESHTSQSHSSKKRQHKDADPPKRAHRDESPAPPYSDFSPGSRHSQVEFSAMSQVANDDRYSSDTEKESKKRAKSKKKLKKELDLSSKPRYEVIDDDYSDDAKKERKKRKRKRDEGDFYESPEIVQEQEYRDQDRKKPTQVRPSQKIHRADKYHSPRDEIEPFQRKTPDRVSIRRDPKAERSLPGGKHDRRDTYEKYREPHKDFDLDRRKGGYDEMERPREERYSPERREVMRQKPQVRHFSSERSGIGSSRKVMDWHGENMKRNSGERKEGIIPRLMSMPHEQDMRGDNPRGPANKYQQRKRPDPDQYRDDRIHLGAGAPERHVMRPNDRRPPPLLSPNFGRGRSPPRLPHPRDNQPYLDPGRFVENDRKFERNYPRDAVMHVDRRDRKYMPVRDEYDNRLSRSGSHDSRSSHPHPPAGVKNKIRETVGLRSPRSDRNSPRDRKPTPDSLKFVKSERTQSHSREITTIKLVKNVDNERGRTGERPRVASRHRDESGGSRHSSLSRDRSKKKRSDAREDRSPSLSSQRRPKETTHSSKDYERKSKSSRKTTSSKSVPDKSNKGKEATKSENRVPEVDWNELDASPKKTDVPKEKSRVLGKFTPGSVLQRTGIIMSMLPEHLINRIIKSEPAIEKESTDENADSGVSDILENGLNSYSDEKLRKHLLGYDVGNSHGYCPPRIINGRTYASSMKAYLQKTRLVDAI